MRQIPLATHAGTITRTSVRGSSGLKQAEDLEDHNDNDNDSDDVEDISVHVIRE